MAAKKPRINHVQKSVLLSCPQKNIDFRALSIVFKTSCKFFIYSRNTARKHSFFEHELSEIYVLDGYKIIYANYSSFCTLNQA